jgi:kynurenine formamidase
MITDLIIDLTLPFRIGMQKYSSDPEFEILEMVEAGVNETTRKVKSAYQIYLLKNHHGTHIDAPAHKIKGGKTIDQYLLEKFINQAVLIDLSDQGICHREQKGITVSDLEEKVDFDNWMSDKIRAVVFYTGFSDLMAEKSGITGEEKTSFERGFPYFTPAAAKYIASNAPFLSLVGIDSFAIDPSGSNSESHLEFLSRDILILETLVNLKELKQQLNKNSQRSENKFYLYSMPLLYSGSDAAQTRAYAIINEKMEEK